MNRLINLFNELDIVCTAFNVSIIALAIAAGAIVMISLWFWAITIMAFVVNK